MSNDVPVYSAGVAAPQTLAAFRNRASARPYADSEYKPPTPDEVRALIQCAGWSQTEAAKIVGASITPGKGSTTIRRWKAPSGSRDARDIPYAAWRLMLLAAGVVSSMEDDLRAIGRGRGMDAEPE